MNIKQKVSRLSRGSSFAIVGMVYLIATAAGIAVYCLLPTTVLFVRRLLIADVLATCLTFAFSLIFGNASVYDPYWSVQPMVILGALAFTQNITPLRFFTLLAVFFWGIRLTANWAYTFHGLGHEDWRYRMLCEKTGKFYPLINFVGIHMVPTLIVYGCTLPAATVLLSPGAGENVISYLALILSLGAATMQGIADIQMHKFRKSGKGGFVRTGLWKHSRHPNYLGEILMWWGIGASAVSALGMNHWFLLAGALANTLLFLFVSIPMADKKQSRKAGFAEYKNETWMLLPIPKGKR
jgi:steroid 5-alpha reductase family enzyme